MRRPLAIWKEITTWIVLGALVLGYLVGQSGIHGGAGWADARQADATPTESAESAELARLQTQVAEMATAAVCTPVLAGTPTLVSSPSAGSTPVPPVAAGEPVAYGDGWTIVVTGLNLAPTIGNYTATGVYAVVGLTITNEGLVERTFAFDDLRLLAASGHSAWPAAGATTSAGTSWYAPIAPEMPVDVVVAFDVPADAEGPFVLGSATDPTFRVLVEVTRLG